MFVFGSGSIRSHKQVFSQLDSNMEQGKVRPRRVSVDSSCYVHNYDNKYKKNNQLCELQTH